MNKKKQIRKKFKEGVFKRDNFTCRVCGFKMEGSYDYFDSHHITDRSLMPNGGYVKENGITVCKDNGYLNLMNGEFIDSCHMKCEKYHITNGNEWNDNLHPNDLYEIIGSSYKYALEMSEKLI